MKRIISSLLVLLTLVSAMILTGCSRADIPISVVSVNKYTDTKGYQQLNIIIKNTSQEHTISSAVVYVKCYSSQGTLLEDRSNGQSLYACKYSACNLATGQLSSENLYFEYSGFDDISYCEIAIKSAALEDGSELTIDTDSLEYIKYTIDIHED